MAKLTFKRSRLKPSSAFQAGDAKEWTEEGGRYRIRLVLRAFGIKLDPPVYQALWLSPQTTWLLLGRHTSAKAAADSCAEHLRGGEISGNPGKLKPKGRKP